MLKHNRPGWKKWPSMLDAHNTCLLVAIVSLSVSAVVIWSAFARHGEQRDLMDGKDAKIRAMLRKLQASQTAMHNNSDSVDRLATLKFISTHFPWLDAEHNLGNYFTQGYFVDNEKYHQKYTHSSLSILPFFQDFDSHFENCLLGMGLTHNQAVSPKMTFWNRHQWDSSNDGVFRFKHKYKIHFGEAAFGVCDGARGTAPISASFSASLGKASDTKVKAALFGAERTGAATDVPGSSGHVGRGSGCGHALIMQDPITMAMADFGACLLDPRGKPLCQLLHNQETSIEEWIAQRGNVVFKNLLFNPSICHGRDIHLGGSVRDKSTSHQDGSGNHYDEADQSWCQGRHEKYLESLEPEVIRKLLDYITENIGRLFSVVGLYEDLPDSFSLLHQVFRFPLHECEFVSRFSDKSFTRSRLKLAIRNMKIEPVLQSTQSKFDFFSDSVHGIDDVVSLSMLVKSSGDDVSLLKALSHFENSVTRRKSSTTSNSLAADSNAEEASSEQFLKPRNAKFNSENIPISQSPEFESGDTKNDAVLHPQFSEDRKNASPVNGSSVYHFDDLISRDNDSLSYGDEIDYDEDFGDDFDFERDEKYKDDVFSEHILSFNSRQLKTNGPWDRLYNQLVNSESVQNALSFDLKIYKAVKKLYLLQKQLYFNSIKIM